MTNEDLVTLGGCGMYEDAQAPPSGGWMCGGTARAKRSTTTGQLLPASGPHSVFNVTGGVQLLQSGGLEGRLAARPVQPSFLLLMERGFKLVEMNQEPLALRSTRTRLFLRKFKNFPGIHIPLHESSARQTPTRLEELVDARYAHAEGGGRLGEDWKQGPDYQRTNGPFWTRRAQNEANHHAR